VEIDITPSQDADINRAEPMLENIDPDAFLADRAYDADRLIDRLIQPGVSPVIPPKRNRTMQREADFALYRSVVLSSGSSINSNSSVPSQPATINWNQHSSLPCSSHQ